MPLESRAILFFLVFCTSAQIGYLFSAYNLIDSIMEEFFSESFEYLFGRSLSSLELTLLWSFCVALKPFGQIIGGLVVGIWKIADRFGRRKTLFLATVIALIGMLFQGLSLPLFNFILFLLGRLTESIANGITVTQLGVFLTEIASTKRRGLVGSTAAFGVTVFCAIYMSLGLPSICGTKTRWAWLCVAGAVPTFGAAFMYGVVCRETPRHLFMNDEIKKATESIAFYQGHERVEEILEELSAEKDTNIRQDEQKTSIAGLLVVLKRNLMFRNRFLIAVTAVCSNTLSSFSLFQQYSTDLLQLVSKFTLYQAQLATIGMGCIAIPAALISMFTVDKFGRRPLILLSCTGLLLVHVALFAGDMVTSAILCLLAFFSHPVFYRLGAGPIPYFVTAELFPQSFRSVASVVCWIMAWSGETVVLFSFTPLRRNIGCWAWLVPMGPLLLILVVLCKFLPETKMKNLAELHESLSRSFSVTSDEKTPLLKLNKRTKYGA